jgi:hypothetical protein
MVLNPFPPQTMQVILAPRGFFPDPLQKAHFFMGSVTSVKPLPLHTRQSETADNRSKGSFPLPLQNVHLIFVMASLD